MVKEMKTGLINKAVLHAALPLAALVFVFVVACAPASEDGGMSMDMEGMAVDESNLNLKIGEQTPPFAMVLSDGTEVSSADLADEEQPAHLFWFATW